jgi:hypothetical protein
VHGEEGVLAETLTNFCVRVGSVAGMDFYTRRPRISKRRRVHASRGNKMNVRARSMS